MSVSGAIRTRETHLRGFPVRSCLLLMLPSRRAQTLMERRLPILSYRTSIRRPNLPQPKRIEPKIPRKEMLAIRFAQGFFPFPIRRKSFG